MSYANHLYHIVFSTKDRRRLIDSELQPQLYEYIGGIIRSLKGVCIEIGGMPDHIHILAKLHQSVATADVMRDLKSSSSRWVNQNRRLETPFCWQIKYGSFTVSESQSATVRRYIQNQELHHKKKSFEDEMRELLKAHGIEVEERYIWE